MSKVNFSGGHAELVLHEDKGSGEAVFQIKFNDDVSQPNPNDLNYYVCHCSNGRVMSIECGMGLSPAFNCLNGTCHCG